MYLEPRYNQCTRGRRHTLTPLRFEFGSHQCAPEFKEIKLLKARLKQLAYLFWVGPWNFTKGSIPKSKQFLKQIFTEGPAICILFGEAHLILIF